MCRTLLIDGDSGRESVNMVNIGLLHLVQELTGIGRQRLDIAALSLCKNGIEGQATLARTGETSDDHQLITRNGHINIFQIVLTSTTDNYFVLGHIFQPSVYLVDY